LFVRGLIILFFLFNMFGHAEIIKFSKLSKGNIDFSFKRDIFYPEVSSRPGRKVIMEEETRELMEERTREPGERLKKVIRQTVLFEGYIEKNDRLIALISANGEFYTVGEGDVVLDNIKVISIEKDKMILEVESQRLEIPLKGDKDE
jgi:predicted RNA-binding protein with PUA domain